MPAKPKAPSASPSKGRTPPPQPGKVATQADAVVHSSHPQLGAIPKMFGLDSMPVSQLRQIVDAADTEVKKQFMPDGSPTPEALVSIVKSKQPAEWKKILGMEAASPPSGQSAGGSKRATTLEEKEAKRQKLLAESRERNAKNSGEKPKQKSGSRATEAVTTEGEKPANNLDENTVSGGVDDLAGYPSEQLFAAAHKARVREGMTFGDEAGLIDLDNTKAADVDMAKFASGVANPFPETVASGPGRSGFESARPQPVGQGEPTPATPPPTGSGATPPDSPKGPSVAETDPIINRGERAAKFIGQSITKRPLTTAAVAVAAYPAVPRIASGAYSLGKWWFGGSNQQNQQGDMDAILRQAVEAERGLQETFGSHGDQSPITIPADTQRKPEDTIRTMKQGAK